VVHSIKQKARIAATPLSGAVRAMPSGALMKRVADPAAKSGGKFESSRPKC
jgi:hypothetical protein